MVEIIPCAVVFESGRKNFVCRIYNVQPGLEGAYSTHTHTHTPHTHTHSHTHTHIHTHTLS